MKDGGRPFFEKRLLNTSLLSPVASFFSDPHLSRTISDPLQISDGQQKIQTLTKQWYMSPTWQHHRTIPWVQGNFFPLTDMYTNLTFVAQKKRQDRILKEYSEMFETDQGNPRRILLEGQPGFGKTLFTHKVASDWAHDYLTTFNIAFVIKLKHAHPGDTISSTIIHQIKTLKDKNVSSGMITDILKSDQFNILLILDGLDEINLDSHPNNKDIILGNSLLNCWLLVTTQPHLVNSFKQHFTLVVLSKGLSMDSLDTLFVKISKLTGMDYSELHRIDIMMDIHHLSNKEKTPDGYYYSPFRVYAALIMYLDENPTPPNYRDLKSFIIHYVVFYKSLIRFILKTNEEAKQLSSEDINSSLWIVMGLAYKGMLQSGPLILGQNEITSENILKLGLLSEQEYSSIWNTTRQVEFIHSTVQEFLAACYIVGMFRDGKENVITDGLYNIIKSKTHAEYFNNFIAHDLFCGTLEGMTTLVEHQP